MPHTFVLSAREAETVSDFFNQDSEGVELRRKSVQALGSRKCSLYPKDLLDRRVQKEDTEFLIH